MQLLLVTGIIIMHICNSKAMKLTRLYSPSVQNI
jgi:hypothetical protein